MTAGRNGVVWGLYFFSKFYTSLEEFAFWRVWIPPEGSQSFSVSKKQKQDTHGISHVAEKTDCYSRLKKIFFHICFFVLFPTNLTGDKSFLLLCNFRFDIRCTWPRTLTIWLFSFLKKSDLRRLFSLYLNFFPAVFFFLVATDPLFSVLFWYAEDTNSMESQRGSHPIFVYSFPLSYSPGLLQFRLSS